jgi:hypothetical protein
MLFIGGRGGGKEVIKNASSLKPSPPRFLWRGGGNGLNFSRFPKIFSEIFSGFP